MNIKALSISYWREWGGERAIFRQLIVDRWDIALVLVILMKVTIDLEGVDCWHLWKHEHGRALVV
jgi:hypothetical protein